MIISKYVTKLCKLFIYDTIFLQQEEQQLDETYEQFEERVLNKRASHMYHVIKNKLDTKDKLTLSEMAFKNNRKQVSILRIYIYHT